MATWSTVQMKDKGSHCITRTCSIAIHRWLIDSHSSIPTTCNDSFISATTISPGKSLLPTPYRASSRAGKKRLLTATHGRRAKKAFARQKSQTSPHPGVAEFLYYLQARITALPADRLFQSRARQAIDQPHYPAAAQHIIFFRDRERASAYGLAGV